MAILPKLQFMKAKKIYIYIVNKSENEKEKKKKRISWEYQTELFGTDLN